MIFICLRILCMVYVLFLLCVVVVAFLVYKKKAPCGRERGKENSSGSSIKLD